MSEIEQCAESPKKEKRRFGCLHVLGFMLLAVLVTIGLAAFWVKHNIYADRLEPTELSEKEERVLDAKMAQLEEAQTGGLQPKPYSEEGAKREIEITEKELNGLIAQNPEWADRIAIDLADDLVSLTILIPMDEEIPIVGGTTARIRTGIGLRYENGRPIVIVKGISIGGIPLPSAWMGDIKNRDLVSEFGDEGGFWDQFAKGVEDIEVTEGRLRLKLKE
jgi:hypothetical protein